MSGRQRTNLGPAGRRWFRDRFGEPPGPIHVSQLHPAEESPTGQPAWWFEVPQREVGGWHQADIFLVYQSFNDPDEFGCLRIPAAFFPACRDYLDFRRAKNCYSLILSAQARDRFVDRRTRGHIRFAPFAWNAQLAGSGLESSALLFLRVSQSC